MHQLRTLPPDTIDLICTAALELEVLTARPGQPQPRRVVHAAAAHLAQCLHQRNPTPELAYRFRKVTSPIDMRDVIKACHAAQFAYTTTPHWENSTEAHAINAILQAATMRIPGYDLAPWMWTRPEHHAIGYAPGWKPDLEQVYWCGGVEELSRLWGSSHLVFLGWDVLAEVPVLPARNRVWVISPAADAAHASQIADEHPLSVEGVVLWPQGQQWLAAQLDR